MDSDVLNGERWRVDEGDCLSWLAGLPDSCVDLIATDPPYFRVKNLPWDRQWKKPEEFIAWIGRLCEQWRRVLKPNWSLYVFASPKMAARVECEVGRWFEVLNHIVWPKADDYTHALRYGDERFRQYVQKSERIVFAEQFGADNRAKGEAGYGVACDELRGFVFEPLRAYLDGERERAGASKPDCDEACGNQMAGHYFTQSQWALPTEPNYLRLRDLFNARGNGSGPYLRREYEDLRREYEDLRREYEDLRRPFAVTADVPYTDVWDFPTVSAYPGKHPCEKPLAMMEHIIRTSSREGAVVLDCFCGSGVTGEAAKLNGRLFLGCDIDPHWAAVARERIGWAARGLKPPKPAREPDAYQQTLFAEAAV